MNDAATVLSQQAFSRLRWRCRRGLLENELIIHHWLDAQAGSITVRQADALNALLDLHLQTGEISRIERGKHTTRHAELMYSGDYAVLDTPGFSLLELWEGLEPIHLKDYYPDFFPYEGECRFSPCYHLGEPDCAVLQAAREGRVSQARLERYHQLLKKVQEAWKKRYD